VAASLAVFTFVLLEYSVFTGTRLIACGSAASPVPGAEQLCASALREPTLVGGGLVVLAVLLAVAGIVLLARTPRSLPS
jgi:hypothetical protein